MHGPSQSAPEPGREADPFTGIWEFNARLSTLSTPLPQSWVQQMTVAGGEVAVHEKIVRLDGSQTVLELRAKFDGREYAVAGSPVVDTMTYVRVQPDVITGIGKRNGFVTLEETATLAPGGNRFALAYAIFSGSRKVAQGIAVFEKTNGANADQ